jgi:hypothetical protein
LWKTGEYRKREIGLKGEAAESSTRSWLPQKDREGIVRPTAQDLPGTDLVKGGG